MGIAQLQRQIAYDRLFARLYELDDAWIVKGVALVTEVSVDAEAQAAAIRSEIDRRGITPAPVRFEVPEQAVWEAGYRTAAEDSLLEVGRTLGDALAIVIPFVDPLLRGTAAGRWDPGRHDWV